MSTEDVTKLPKWAQNQLLAAEGRASHAEERLRESLGEGFGASDTQVHMGWGEKSAGLPNGTMVNFHLDSGIVSARVVDGHLEITSQQGLAVMPWVSNVIHVEAKV